MSLAAKLLVWLAFFAVLLFAAEMNATHIRAIWSYTQLGAIIGFFFWGIYIIRSEMPNAFSHVFSRS